MAKIVEQTIVIKTSLLVKDSEDFNLPLDKDTKAMMEAMVGELLAIPGLIIEADLLG